MGETSSQSPVVEYNIGFALIPLLNPTTIIILHPNIGREKDIPTLGVVIVWDFTHFHDCPNLGFNNFFLCSQPILHFLLRTTFSWYFLKLLTMISCIIHYYYRIKL